MRKYVCILSRHYNIRLSGNQLMFIHTCAFLFRIRIRRGIKIRSARTSEGEGRADMPGDTLSGPDSAVIRILSIIEMSLTAT